MDKIQTPFKSSLLYKDSNIGKYELYVDGSTGWGIIFSNGYIEVEEGPHRATSKMTAEINGVSFVKSGYNVPIIPDQYWMGDMSTEKLSKFFDDILFNYEIEFYSDKKEAMVDTVLMMFEDKLNDKDITSLKNSLERTWDNGFRYGIS